MFLLLSKQHSVQGYLATIFMTFVFCFLSVVVFHFNADSSFHKPLDVKFQVLISSLVVAIAFNFKFVACCHASGDDEVLKGVAIRAVVK